MTLTLFLPSRQRMTKRHCPLVTRFVRLRRGQNHRRAGRKLTNSQAASFKHLRQARLGLTKQIGGGGAICPNHYINLPITIPSLPHPPKTFRR